MTSLVIGKVTSMASDPDDEREDADLIVLPIKNDHLGAPQVIETVAAHRTWVTERALEHVAPRKFHVWPLWKKLYLLFAIFVVLVAVSLIAAYFDAR
jgi:hypothetical protein